MFRQVVATREAVPKDRQIAAASRLGGAPRNDRFLKSLRVPRLAGRSNPSPSRAESFSNVFLLLAQPQGTQRQSGMYGYGNNNGKYPQLLHNRAYRSRQIDPGGQASGTDQDNRIPAYA